VQSGSTENQTAGIHHITTFAESVEIRKLGFHELDFQIIHKAPLQWTLWQKTKSDNRNLAHLQIIMNYKKDTGHKGTFSMNTTRIRNPQSLITRKIQRAKWAAETVVGSGCGTDMKGVSSLSVLYMASPDSTIVIWSGLRFEGNVV